MPEDLSNPLNIGKVTSGTAPVEAVPFSPTDLSNPLGIGKIPGVEGLEAQGVGVIAPVETVPQMTPMIPAAPAVETVPFELPKAAPTPFAPIESVPAAPLAPESVPAILPDTGEVVAAPGAQTTGFGDIFKFPDGGKGGMNLTDQQIKDAVVVEEKPAVGVIDWFTSGVKQLAADVVGGYDVWSTSSEIDKESKDLQLKNNITFRTPSHITGEPVDTALIDDMKVRFDLLEAQKVGVDAATLEDINKRQLAVINEQVSFDAPGTVTIENWKNYIKDYEALKVDQTAKINALSIRQSDKDLLNQKLQGVDEATAKENIAALEAARDTSNAGATKIAAKLVNSNLSPSVIAAEQQALIDVIVEQDSRFDISKGTLRRRKASENLSAEDLAVIEPKIAAFDAEADQLKNRYHEYEELKVAKLVLVGDPSEAQELAMAEIKKKGFRDLNEFLMQDAKSLLKNQNPEDYIASQRALLEAEMIYKARGLSGIQPIFTEAMSAVGSQLNTAFNSIFNTAISPIVGTDESSAGIGTLGNISLGEERVSGFRKNINYAQDIAPEVLATLSTFLIPSGAGQVRVLTSLPKVFEGIASLRVVNGLRSLAFRGGLEAVKDLAIGAQIQSNIPVIYSKADEVVDSMFLPFNFFGVGAVRYRNAFENYGNIINNIYKGQSVSQVDFEKTLNAVKSMENTIYKMNDADPAKANQAAKESYARSFLNNYIESKGGQINPEDMDILTKQLKGEIDDPNNTVADMIKKSIPTDNTHKDTTVIYGPWISKPAPKPIVTPAVIIPEPAKAIGIEDVAKVHTPEEIAVIQKKIDDLPDGDKLKGTKVEDLFEDGVLKADAFKKLEISDSRTIQDKVSSRYLTSSGKSSDTFFKAIVDSGADINKYTPFKSAYDTVFNAVEKIAKDFKGCSI